MSPRSSRHYNALLVNSVVSIAISNSAYINRSINQISFLRSPAPSLGASRAATTAASGSTRAHRRHQESGSQLRRIGIVGIIWYTEGQRCVFRIFLTIPGCLVCLHLLALRLPSINRSQSVPSEPSVPSSACALHFPTVSFVCIS